MSETSVFLQHWELLKLQGGLAAWAGGSERHPQGVRWLRVRAGDERSSTRRERHPREGLCRLGPSARLGPGELGWENKAGERVRNVGGL